MARPKGRGLWNRPEYSPHGDDPDPVDAGPGAVHDGHGSDAPLLEYMMDRILEIQMEMSRHLLEEV